MSAGVRKQCGSRADPSRALPLVGPTPYYTFIARVAGFPILGYHLLRVVSVKPGGEPRPPPQRYGLCTCSTKTTFEATGDAVPAPHESSPAEVSLPGLTYPRPSSFCTPSLLSERSHITRTVRLTTLRTLYLQTSAWRGLVSPASRMDYFRIHSLTPNRSGQLPAYAAGIINYGIADTFESVYEITLRTSSQPFLVITVFVSGFIIQFGNSPFSPRSRDTGPAVTRWYPLRSP